MILRKRPNLAPGIAGLVLTRAPVAPQAWMVPGAAAPATACYRRAEDPGDLVRVLTEDPGDAVRVLTEDPGDVVRVLTEDPGDVVRVLTEDPGDVVRVLTEDPGDLNVGEEC